MASENLADLVKVSLFRRMLGPTALVVTVNVGYALITEELLIESLSSKGYISNLDVILTLASLLVLPGVFAILSWLVERMALKGAKVYKGEIGKAGTIIKHEAGDSGLVNTSYMATTGRHREGAVVVETREQVNTAVRVKPRTMGGNIYDFIEVGGERIEPLYVAEQFREKQGFIHSLDEVVPGEYVLVVGLIGGGPTLVAIKPPGGKAMVLSTSSTLANLFAYIPTIAICLLFGAVAFMFVGNLFESLFIATISAVLVGSVFLYAVVIRNSWANMVVNYVRRRSRLYFKSVAKKRRQHSHP